MRILYGVQGTGNGHITRARMLGPALEARGAQIDYLFSGRDPNAYFGMELFGNYQCREGFTLKTEAGQLKAWQTITGSSPAQFIRDVKNLDTRHYDLVLSDFEPITAWAARLQGTPSIGVAHQYAFNYRIPGRECFGLIAPIMKWFAPAKDPVGLHWNSFGAPLLPPMVAPVRSAAQSAPRQVVVYLPFESLDRLISFLAPIQSHDFKIFADVVQPFKRGSVEILPLSREGFADALAISAGVFANAGFGVCSEAIQAGKRLLVKPVIGQIEQEANAVALERLDLGAVMRQFDHEKFELWLNSLKRASATQGRIKAWPATAELLADWIMDPERPSVRDLSAHAWSRAPRHSSSQTITAHSAMAR